ncbi:MAG: hypothetical protein HW417_1166, partial [Steroidobacteraceae bacterium]|nr:hypothetical protein [Steroidobacteraceae bacterium]
MDWLVIVKFAAGEDCVYEREPRC